LRKDYVCTPENIERAFCFLTVSSNIGDRTDSVQKSDHSDRHDVISGERVAVISSYRINDKQKIRSQVLEFFFVTHRQTGRYQFRSIRNRNEVSTWCSKSAEEYSGVRLFAILFYIHKLLIPDTVYEFIYFCDYFVENKSTSFNATYICISEVLIEWISYLYRPLIRYQ